MGRLRAAALVLVAASCATAPLASSPAPATAIPPSAAVATPAATSPAPAPATPTPAASPSCPQGALFSVLPMDPRDFRAFRPLGFPQPPVHVLGAKHSSFTINLPGEPAVSGKPVRFPADATVTEIVSTESREGTGYQLTFFPCREFKSYFFHLGTLAAPLEAALKGQGASCQDFDFGAQGGRIRKCTARVSVAVKAGDPVGGNDQFGGVDWGGVDYRVTLPFINPARYDGDYPHYVSPIDYTTAAVRALVDPKLGSIDGKTARTAEPRTGTLMHDIAGTAQGNWFTPGTSFMNTQDFSPWLALLHDYVDPSLPIISMGSSVMGLRLGLYAFTPERSGTVNRDFADVKPDGTTHCYERFHTGQTRSALNLATAAGAILLRMPSPTTLAVEFQQGATCATARPIGAGATTFER